NLKARFSDRHQAGSARLAHDQRRLEILRVKQALDDASGGLMLSQDIAQGLRDFDKATGMLPGLRTVDRSKRQGLRVRLSQSDNSVAGCAQRGINAENDAMPLSRCAKLALQDRRSATLRAVEAVLHLLKLLRCNAHGRSLPKQARLQRRIVFPPSVLSGPYQA